MQRATFGKRVFAQTAFVALDRAERSYDGAAVAVAAIDIADAALNESRTSTGAPRRVAVAASLEHVAWSYFKACVVAFATALLVSGPMLESNASDGMLSRMFMHAVSGVVMIQLAPLLAIPIRILADVARLVRIPRGYSDALIGGLAGCVMMLPDLTSGLPPRPLSWCFVFGGCFGGFFFWRARRYPGLTRGDRGGAERLYRLLRRVRGRLAT